MSGASIPYALRQNKFVDRRIFIDLLSLVERYKVLDEHVYISMGGATLEDHRLAHEQLGFKKMFSFDGEHWVVGRQRFNCPVDLIKTKRLTSSELISRFSAEMIELGFGGSPNVAIWLDFTSPKQIGIQLRELNQLLDVLQPMDVVRITVNANPDALYSRQTVDSRPETSDVVFEKRFIKLKARLQEYFPNDIIYQDMSVERLPIAISRAIEIATKKAFPGTSEHCAVPLSLLRYADQQQMLSCTFIILKRNEVPQFIEKTKFDLWPFKSDRWVDIHEISIPELTLRERIFINNRINTETSLEIAISMGFWFEDDDDLTDKNIEQYRRFYRYFPQFQHVPT